MQKVDELDVTVEGLNIKVSELLSLRKAADFVGMSYEKFRTYCRRHPEQAPACVVIGSRRHWAKQELLAWGNRRKAGVPPKEIPA